MAAPSKNSHAQHGASERRSCTRYQLSPSPEVEILQGDDGTAIRASLGDISRGGCYLHTDFALPLEAEVTVILKLSGDLVRAQARVVRAALNKGLALEFTSMESEDFRILETWLSSVVVKKWLAANRRRAQRVAIQIAVSVSGYDEEGERFMEDTQTLVISAYGCLVTLSSPVKKGQRVVLSSPQTNRTSECIVARHEARGTSREVGLAFSVPNQQFWPISFPPSDWSPQHPDAKQFHP
jgi:c-di-GMP-binding flagellar brake protein YcgR